MLKIAKSALFGNPVSDGNLIFLAFTEFLSHSIAVEISRRGTINGPTQPIVRTPGGVRWPAKM
jgi:hypothetical protein